MQCPKCNAPAEPGAIFCDQCATILDGPMEGTTALLATPLPAETPFPILYQQDVDRVWWTAYRTAVHSMGLLGDVGVRAQEFSVKHAVQAPVPLDDIILFLGMGLQGQPTPEWLKRVVAWGAHKVMVMPNPGIGTEENALIARTVHLVERIDGGYQPTYGEISDYVKITMAYVNPVTEMR